jgi:hypothetical protein
VLASALARPPFELELEDESLLDDSFEVDGSFEDDESLLDDSFEDESLLDDSFEVDESDELLEESDSRSLRRPLALEPWSFL